MHINVVGIKKGNRYRFAFALELVGSDHFMMYQTKSEFGTKKVNGVNLSVDKWFPNAKYIGLDLEEEE